VRGLHYLQDWIKIQPSPPLLHLLGVDLFSVKDAKRKLHLLGQPKYHISALRNKLGSSAPWLFVINFIVKAAHITICWTSGSPSAPNNSLLQRLINEGEGFRSTRLKLIPRIPEGNLLVRKTVGTKPVILGKWGLDISYHRAPGYLEIDIDLTTSRIANGIWKVVERFAAVSVIDLAFVIEGQTREELPEELLATVRFYRGTFVHRPKDA